MYIVQCTFITPFVTNCTFITRTYNVQCTTYVRVINVQFAHYTLLTHVPYLCVHCTLYTIHCTTSYCIKRLFYKWKTSLINIPYIVLNNCTSCNVPHNTLFLDNVYCIVNTISIHNTEYTYSILYSIHYTVYSIHYPLQYTLYIVHCAIYCNTQIQENGKMGK